MHTSDFKCMQCHVKCPIDEYNVVLAWLFVYTLSLCFNASMPGPEEGYT